MSPKKLDVRPAVIEAYSGAWNHINEMVRLIWLPGLLYILGVLLASVYQARNEMLLAVLLNLATLFLWPIIAVAWHRFILLGDTTNRAFNFTFGRRHTRFLIATVLIVLMLILGLTLLMVGNELAQTAPDKTGTITMLMLGGFTLLGLAAYYVPRLSLLLPAVAVDDAPDPRLLIEATRGNYWRLIALVALTSMPVIVPYYFLAVILVLIGMPPAIMLIFAPVVTIFLAILNVAVLSIAYRELVGPAGTLPPRSEPENPLA